jgi:hypothetical protein
MHFKYVSINLTVLLRRLININAIYIQSLILGTAVSLFGTVLFCIQAKSACLGESSDVFNNLTSIKWEVMEMNLFSL